MWDLIGFCKSSFDKPPNAICMLYVPEKMTQLPNEDKIINA
jgi:hypothetical protein